VTGGLAKRYARALLELAREEESVEASGEELARAVAAFEEPRLALLMSSPAVDPVARLRTAKAVAAAIGLSNTLAKFVALLAERNRLAVLADVGRWYERLLDDELERARVTIRSAAPLSVAEKNDLLELARRLTGRHEILTTTEVAPELLGGVVLDVRGTVYDGSVKTQLERLTKGMAEGGA